MNLIKNSVLVFSVLVVCYLMLVIGDWLIDKYANSMFIRDESVVPIEELNEILSNEKRLIKENLSKGITLSISPNNFERQTELKNKMLELNIGAIGGAPNTMVFVACNEGYGSVTFRSDRFGLRNKDQKWNGNIDTLFIGDSFTYGECVSNESVISSQYEAMTEKLALNLGGSSNNPKHYATLAQLFIPRTEPQEVFLVFYPNDKGVFDSIIFDVHVKNRSPFFKDRSNELLPLESYSELQNFALRHFSEERKPLTKDLLPIFIDSLKYRGQLPTIRRIISTVHTELIGDSKIAIELALKNCRTSKCDVKVVYIPNSEYWDPDNRAEHYVSTLKKYTESKQMTFFDASKVINKKKGSTDYALKGAHLSPLGYYKVAKLIAN